LFIHPKGEGGYRRYRNKVHPFEKKGKLRERKRNSAPIPKEKEFRDQKGKQRKIISTPNLQMKKN
jgi:hypothetical protein